MSKFLLMSGAGDGLGLALRLKQEGHNVAAWVRDFHAKKNYDGLLQKVKKWEEFLDRNTIVVFDSNGGGKTAERLRSRGNPVFAGSVFADQLELDRSIAFALMQEVGIKVPPSETFTDWGEAKKYMRGHDKRVAFKPSGELAVDLHSYLSKDPEDMLEMLDWFQDQAKVKPEFELQDYVEGHAISTEGWFNGKEFMSPFNHTFERKQLMNDDIGPSGGCSGNIMWHVLEGPNRVITEGISKFSPLLSEQGYIGPIDLNTIVNDEGVWALEFTPRFGYDALPSFLETLNEPIGDLIERMARGTYPKEIKVKQGFGAGVRITIPPAPSEEHPPAEGLPIRGFSRDDRPHLYFYDVMFNEKNRLVNTSAYGNIVVCTSYGDTRHEAMSNVYKLVDKAKIPNMQYRTDLTSRFSDDYSNLAKYLNTPEERYDINEGQLVESQHGQTDPVTVGISAGESDPSHAPSSD